MTVRHLFAAIPLLALLLPGTAAAQNADGSFYGELRGGATFLSDSDLNGSGTLGEVDFDTGGLVEGAVGFHHDSGLRGELAIGYRKNDLGKFTISDGRSNELDGDISAFTTMVNLVYEIDLNKLGGGGGSPSRFRPFLGGGIGMAVLTSSGDLEDDSDNVFAYQAIGGVAYHINSNWAVTASYAYLATADPQFEGVDAEYESHNVMAGVRYSF